MNAIIIDKNKIILELSFDELGAIGNSFNEVCNGFEAADFDQKIGVSQEVFRGYLKYLNEISKIVM